MKRFFTKCLMLSFALVLVSFPSSVAVEKEGGIVPHIDKDEGILRETLSDTAVLAFTEFGWVTFTIDAEYKEFYTQVESVVTLTQRNTFWSVTASRSGSGARTTTSPYVKHHNSSGSTVRSFTMLPDDPAVIYCPPIGGMHEYSEVYYDCTAGYYGSTGFSISASNIVMPYGKEIRVDFDLAPL